MTLMQIYTQTRNDEPCILKASTAALLQEGRAVFSWHRKGQKGLYGHSRVSSLHPLSVAPRKEQGARLCPSPLLSLPVSPAQATTLPSWAAPIHEVGGVGGQVVERRRRSTHDEEKRECSVSAFLPANPASPPSFLPLFLAEESTGWELSGRTRP